MCPPHILADYTNFKFIKYKYMILSMYFCDRLIVLLCCNDTVLLQYNLVNNISMFQLPNL